MIVYQHYEVQGRFRKNPDRWTTISSYGIDRLQEAKKELGLWNGSPDYRIIRVEHHAEEFNV